MTTSALIMSRAPTATATASASHFPPRKSDRGSDWESCFTVSGKITNSACSSGGVTVQKKMKPLMKVYIQVFSLSDLDSEWIHLGILPSVSPPHWSRSESEDQIVSPPAFEVGFLRITGLNAEWPELAMKVLLGSDSMSKLAMKPGNSNRLLKLSAGTIMTSESATLQASPNSCHLAVSPPQQVTKERLELDYEHLTDREFSLMEKIVSESIDFEELWR
ncbi:hypothetical protein EDB19DRAFT_1836161 [Suillus lakei]|nr:hypothetical protein EDB19DRAFT_1836161 [Suillus lakei]